MAIFTKPTKEPTRWLMITTQAKHTTQAIMLEERTTFTSATPTTQQALGMIPSGIG